MRIIIIGDLICVAIHIITYATQLPPRMIIINTLICIIISPCSSPTDRNENHYYSHSPTCCVYSLISDPDTLHVDQCECFPFSPTDSKPRHGPIGSYPVPLHTLPCDRGMPRIVPTFRYSNNRMYMFKHSFVYVPMFICICFVQFKPMFH